MKRKLIPLALTLALFCAMATPAGAYDMGKVGEPQILSAGAFYTMVIKDDGSLWAWGDNADGQLGNGGGGNAEDDTRDPCQTIPVKVLDNVATVSAGNAHTMAIKTDGSLWAWGDNSLGQLGNGTTKDRSTPVKVLENVAAVSAGNNYTVAIKTDGSLWAWGDNSLGQLGDGTTKDRSTPVKVLENVAAVSAGIRSQTLAIKTDGSLWAWGSNADGQLGNGGEGNEKSYWGYPFQTIPVKVLDNVAAVSAGDAHTMAIKTDGSLWAWGLNCDGRLGNGTTSECSIPVKVLDNVTAVSAGGGHTMAIKTDGSLWAWGWNGYGELGNGGVGNAKDGDGRTIQTVPVKVMDNVTAVSAGFWHTMAIKTDGSLWAWGDNSTFQLGNGGGGNAKPESGAPFQTVPVKISPFTAPLGVRLQLNGGLGAMTIWTASDSSIAPPTNPTKAGYSFGGWYTDETLTKVWNFNNSVKPGMLLYAKWVTLSSTDTKTKESKSGFQLDGKSVMIQAYALKASSGGDVTFVKLRDVAKLLDGTPAQCNVDFKNKTIYVATHAAYSTPNGGELKAISGSDGSYKLNTNPILFDGTTAPLEGIVITDGKGGGHTYFKLRDLAKAIGFYVGWSAEKGIYIETDKPYSE